MSDNGSTHQFDRRNPNKRLNMGQGRKSIHFSSSPAKHKYYSGQGQRSRLSHTVRRTKSRNYNRGPRISRGAFLKGSAVAVAAIAGGSWFAWDHSVHVNVNGQDLAVSPNYTMEDLIRRIGFKPARGNYTSVAGRVLKKDEGYEWTAYVNEQRVLPGEDFVIQDGDTIIIQDGDNMLEPHTVEYKEEEPHVKFSGPLGGTIRYISQWPQAGKEEMLFGKETGEKAPGQVISKLQDLVITTASVNPKGTDKLCALTFDDGPSKYTAQYLDILKEKGVKATFFQLGENIKQFPEVEKRIVNEGHQVANHSYDHKNLAELSAKDVADEIKSTMELIKEYSGVSTTMFRPPYGSFPNKCWWEAEGYATSSIMWTHDTIDWKLPGPDALHESATKNVQNGSIILMHDGGAPREDNVAALPRIIDTLLGQGFKLVTMEELMKADPNIPADIADGSATRPADCTWPASPDSSAEKKAKESEDKQEIL